MRRRIRKIGDQLGPIEDGDVLRVGMADSKNPMQRMLNDYVERATRMAISDGTGNPFALNRPGYRTYTDAGMRADRAEDRELNRLDALTDADNDFKNTSPSWSGSPPTGQGAHDVPGVKQIKPGTSCTINGWPGAWQWVSGTMTCIPNNRSADSLSIYDAYDLQIADAWRGNKEAWIGPNLQKEQEEEDEETDDDDDDEEEGEEFLREAFEEGVQEAYRNTATHAESTIRPDTQDRLQREHDERMRQLGPMLRRDRAFMDQVATQQKAREKIMDAEYSRYEEELREAYRK